MAGDDWCYFDEQRAEYSVRRAVEEFFLPRAIQILIEPGDPNYEWQQWVVRKSNFWARVRLRKIWTASRARLSLTAHRYCPHD